ncbi:6-carboxytetrahydropterin synthase [Halobacteria archaeon AArc-dxtr1]|nr:6-carboxytetrahydropterin synthase [Halobacteria archaeon AArc-dxtr1]
MYAVSVSRSFVAQHYLTVPDPGPEGRLHSHCFDVEIEVAGPERNEYEYLVDIDNLTAAVDDTVDAFRDETLNELPPFDGRNPSVELLAKTLGDRLLKRFDPVGATRLRVAIEEDDVATVSHERAL